MASITIKHISECFIKPKYEVEGAKKPYYLAPMELAMLSLQYIQQGLLFKKPSHINHQKFCINQLVRSLKDSLSLALVHFYPLAGQLATQINQKQHTCSIFIDCKKGPGAKFIHAELDMTISDILSPTYVPKIVQSFFDHFGDANHDGHHKPLLSVQVTSLCDGVFIGCSINHCVLDGTSFWHFWKIWSEIHRFNNEKQRISSLYIHDRWFPEGYNPTNSLPYIHPDEFISQFKPCEIRERFFHFTSESIERLKSKANNECKTNKISSFQSLSAFVWRSIVRAKGLSNDQITNCKLATNIRHRLDPPLNPHYLGCCATVMVVTTTVGELLGQSLGYAASLVHQSVQNYNHKKVFDVINGWIKSPIIHQPLSTFDSNSVMMSSSPRFDVYGNEFGLGKAVAVRTGNACKMEGKVSSFPGYEGGGSVDLEICLTTECMRALESDQVFMDAVSLIPIHGV